MKYFKIILFILTLFACNKVHKVPIGLPITRTIYGKVNQIDNTEEGKINFVKMTFTRLFLADLIKSDIKESKNFNYYNDISYYHILFDVFPPPACLLRMEIKELLFPDFEAQRIDKDWEYHYYEIAIKHKEKYSWNDSINPVYNLIFECDTIPFAGYYNKFYYTQSPSPSIPTPFKSLITPVKTNNYLVVLSYKKSDIISTEISQPIALLNRSISTGFYILSKETGYYKICNSALRNSLQKSIHIKKHIKNVNRKYRRFQLESEMVDKDGYFIENYVENSYKKEDPKSYIPFLQVMLYSDYLPENFQFIKSDKKHLYFEFFSKTYENKALIKINAEQPDLFKIKIL